MVSVIIPVYNKAHFLPDTLKSVFAQNYKDIEVIIVDDGSTDNVLSAVEPYKNKVKFVRQSNMGVSLARNKGIQIASGDFVCFLDADDVFLPEKIKRQIDYFEQHPECDLVYTNGIVVDQKGNRVCDGCVQRKTGYSGDVFRELLIRNFITTSSVMVRKEKILFQEPFKQKYKASQDYDLWLTLSRDCNFGYLDDFLFEYRTTASGITSRHNYLMYQEHIDILREIPKKARLDLIDNFFRTLGLSLHYFEWGIDCFYQRDFLLARKRFFVSIMCFPLNFKVWFYFLACLLPGRILIYAISFVKKIRGGQNQG